MQKNNISISPQNLLFYSDISLPHSMHRATRYLRMEPQNHGSRSMWKLALGMKHTYQQIQGDLRRKYEG